VLSFVIDLIFSMLFFNFSKLKSAALISIAFFSQTLSHAATHSSETLYLDDFLNATSETGLTADKDVTQKKFKSSRTFSFLSLVFLQYSKATKSL